MKDIPSFIVKSAIAMAGSFTFSYQLLSRVEAPKDSHSPIPIASHKLTPPHSSPPVPYSPPTSGKSSADSQSSIPFANDKLAPPYPRDPVPHSPPATGKASAIDLSQWEYLISFRPPVGLQEETLRYQNFGLKLWYKNAYTNWFVQRIEDAVGSVNLDYYPVLVRKMPIKNDVVQAPASLLLDIRQSINSYISDGYTAFEPYNSSWDKACASETPAEALGCYFFINILLAYSGGFARDDGTVMISEITPEYWIFTTVFAVGHRGSIVNGGSSFHPITGNRQFGYKRVPEGFIFYTRGVDRVSDSARFIGSSMADAIGVGAFSSGDRLWRSFQTGLVERVRRNGGEAIALPPIQLIESWNYSVEKYHRPSVPWIDRLPTGQAYPYADDSQQ